jgi:hypothetical protein
MLTARKVTTTLVFLIASLAGGCGFKDQRVGLTYENIVGAGGGGGELSIAKPLEQYALDKTPGGLWILGTVNGTEGAVVTGDSVDDWFLNALAEELSAAGYHVKTVTGLPEDAVKGCKPAVLKISADQTLSLITAETVVRLKLSVEVWKEGKLVKTVSVSAGNEDKGIDHSTGHLSYLLMNTLQNAMRNIVPDLIEALEE